MNIPVITGAARSIRKAFGAMLKSSFDFRLAVTLLLLAIIASASHGQEARTAAGDLQSSCQEIAVFGAVRQPGRFKAKPEMRLLEVLALVGGPNPQAGKIVRLVHSCKCSPCNEAEGKAGDVHEYNLASVLRGRENAIPRVVPGDIVIVPAADTVFVIGGLIGGRSVLLSLGMTLTRAIAVAGVAVGSSELVTVRIYRNSSDGTRQSPIIVGLKAVRDGRSENVLLRPGDIVEVSDELGHFPAQKLSPPTWDPPLLPRKDNSGL